MPRVLRERAGGVDCVSVLGGGQIACEYVCVCDCVCVCACVCVRVFACVLVGRLLHHARGSEGASRRYGLCECVGLGFVCVCVPLVGQKLFNAWC